MGMFAGAAEKGGLPEILNYPAVTRNIWMLKT